jgi:hypothetical protein
MHVAMQRGSGEARDVQAVSDAVSIAFGRRENHSLFNCGITQQMIKQAILVQQVVNEVNPLLDVFMAR